MDQRPFGHLCPHPGASVEPFDQVFDLVDGQLAASDVDEQHGGGEVEVVIGEAGETGGEVGVEDLVEPGFDGDGPGLVAFPGDLQATGPSITFY